MTGTDELIRGLAEKLQWTERKTTIEQVLRECGLAEILAAVNAAIALYDSDPQLELREFKARQFLQTALASLRSKVVGQ